MPAASHRGDCCRLRLGGGVPLPRCGSGGCCLNLGMGADELVGLALISCRGGLGFFKSLDVKEKACV